LISFGEEKGKKKSEALTLRGKGGRRGASSSALGELPAYRGRRERLSAATKGRKKGRVHLKRGRGKAASLTISTN